MDKPNQKNIGHSLGGYLANAINHRVKGIDNIPIQIYHAPLITGIPKIKPNVMDYSTIGDIVSILDGISRRQDVDLNPISAHST